MAYTLQKPFEEELERLQKQDIIAPQQIEETSEWCNSFVLVPKANGEVTLPGPSMVKSDTKKTIT